MSRRPSRTGPRRREVLAGGGAWLASGSVRAEASPQASTPPLFRTDDAGWQAAYDKAQAVLAANVRVVPRYSRPVLIEGADYAGIWMESGPNEALVWRKFRPDVARFSHLAFFALQRADGQLPANNKVSETGFGQIQMCVPIAATAWELARATGDEELLRVAYAGCSAWDGWLRRHRNTRGTGLTEGFCTFDTGMDNSARWAGRADQCPNKDAEAVPPDPTLPRLCPDLSATTYGARKALSAMARALGRRAEADRWLESAADIRARILSRLYAAEDAAFYDRDAQDRFVRIRCDILSRVCGEHVPDQALFDTLWTRQIHNPHAFWATYPLPSVALDDPAFQRPIVKNSWGAPSQALTALRAPRWFDHYGRAAEFSAMMTRWCEALRRDMTFRQQMDPQTGAFTQADPPNYSPAALVLVDFIWRLAGVTEQVDALHWNVRPDHSAARLARFEMTTDARRTAVLRYDARGAGLELAGRPIGRLSGGTARLVTDPAGAPRELWGVAETVQRIEVELAQRQPRTVELQPNARLPL